MKTRDMTSSRGSLVYSSETGSICPRCGKPRARCACTNGPVVPTNHAGVRVGIETQGRRGKAVTVIEGVPLAPEELARLATDLKRRCSSGGTVRSGTIEIQGDKRETVVATLQRLVRPPFAYS